MAWLRHPALLVAAALYSVVAALVFKNQSGGIFRSDPMGTILLLAFICFPYLLLYMAGRLSTTSLSRFTCAMSNVLSIGIAAWLYAYSFWPIDDEYGVVYMATPLIQCLLAGIALLIALWGQSDHRGAV